MGSPISDLQSPISGLQFARFAAEQTSPPGRVIGSRIHLRESNGFGRRRREHIVLLYCARLGNRAPNGLLSRLNGWPGLASEFLRAPTDMFIIVAKCANKCSSEESPSQIGCRIGANRPLSFAGRPPVALCFRANNQWSRQCILGRLTSSNRLAVRT